MASFEMKFVVIFTFGAEKYAVKITASEKHADFGAAKEYAILEACKQMIDQRRHYDSAECVPLI